MRVKRRKDHTWRLFFKRTVSAQIHLLTCFFAIVAIRILLPLVEQRGALQSWAVLIFGATSILLFAMSSVFHFMMDGFEMSDKLEAFR
jgi:channel protein (hemolysin III family)